MAHTPQHDAKIKALESGLKQLSDKLSSFDGHARQVDELLPVIHRPGWTTLAEVTMVSGMVESMNRHLDVLSGLHAALVQGAQAVGKG
jgi:hypothetical protein